MPSKSDSKIWNLNYQQAYWLAFMFNEKEIFFLRPYCAQQVSFLVEELFGNQKYIEDCEVCCQPIEIHIFVEDGKVLNFDVQRSH